MSRPRREDGIAPLQRKGKSRQTKRLTLELQARVFRKLKALAGPRQSLVSVIEDLVINASYKPTNLQISRSDQ